MIPKFPLKYLFYLAWIQSIVATLGSLYFSEIAKYPPCILCWYQRIVMYPLVLIIAVGILKKDKSLPQYVLPLSITGLFISGYHCLLYYKIFPDSILPCVQGVSCTTRFFAWFGFITIPLLSFIAFAVITASMIIYLKLQKKDKKK